MQKFKDYVHASLDAAGVPTDPESPHKAEGCRIGGRLDVLIGERDTLRGLLREAKADLEKIVCTEGCDAGVIYLSSESPTHYDPEVKWQVYNHENFSPLGDALVALHAKIDAALGKKP